MGIGVFWWMQTLGSIQEKGTLALYFSTYLAQCSRTPSAIISAAGSKHTNTMSFPWDKADLAVTSTQKYTQPSKSKVTVASLVFPASDRLSEPTLSETQSRYIRHSATTIASANDEGSGAGGAKPHDIPDYKGAAEYMKRGFVKLGYENVGHGDTESRAAFPSMASTLYLNPRAAKVVPLSGTGLCLGNDAPSFATDSRDAFTRPPAGARGLTHHERLAINLAVNVAKFQLGVETAPGGGFETTSRHAAAEMIAASRKAGGASSSTGHHTMHGSLIKKGEEDAAHLAKVTHINFSADAQEKNDFSTTSRAGQPRYPTSAYAERTGPVDPSAAAGAIGHATTALMVKAKTGEVITVPRVMSGLDLGRDAPVYQTEAMDKVGHQEEKKNPGGKLPPLNPAVHPLKYVKWHPSLENSPVQ